MTGAITESVLDAGSLQDRLRAAKVVQTAGTHELAIPGYGGQLVARYRTLEWRERRRIGLAVKGLDIPGRELDAAADILLTSCEGVDAHVDGQVIPLGHRLGVELAGYLGEDVEGVTPRQALFLIFPSELALMGHLEELSALQLSAEEEADGEIAKN